jgi:predicted RND superfamily exporter protein
MRPGASQSAVQRLNAISNALGRLLIGSRHVVVVGFLLLTVLALPAALSVRLDPGYDKSVPSNHQYTETFRKYQSIFGGGNEVVVALRQINPGSTVAIERAPFLETLAKVTDEVFFLPGVNRPTVRSIFTPNVHFVAVTKDGFRGGNIVPSGLRGNPAAMGASGIAQIKENLLKSDEVGRLVSNDFNGAIVRGEVLERDAYGRRLDYKELSSRLEKIRTEYTSENIHIAIVGFPKFIGEVINAVARGWMYFLIALSLTLILLRQFLGGWALPICAVGVALIAVIWQLGLVGLLGYGIDPLSVLVPFLIFSIGVSHAVQMCSAWANGVITGENSIAAAEGAFNRLFIPGTTALLGNAAGFAVIMMIDIPIIEELGVAASVGVAVMIITNKLLLPAILSMLPCSYASNPKNAHLLTRALANVSNFARSVSFRGVGIAVVLLFGVAFIGRANLKIGDIGFGAPELYESSVYNRDLRQIADSFSVGIDSLVAIAEVKPDSCTNPSVLRALDDMEWDWKKLPMVSAVVGLPDYVKKGFVGNSEGYPKWSMIPTDPTLIALAIRPIELSVGLFNAECSALPITLYTRNHDAATIRAVTDAIKKSAHDSELVDIKLALGNLGVMAAINEVIEDAQVVMVSSLFMATGMLCFLTFFSWRAVACVVVPLLLSAVMCDAVMAWLGIGLKVPTLPVVALGVGVGVDYGIYLLARIMSDFRHGKTIGDACDEALQYAGRPIVITAMTMSIGIATWLLSPLKFQADAALLLMFMFVFNMVGALLLVPAFAAKLFRHNVDVHHDAEGADEQAVFG